MQWTQPLAIVSKPSHLRGLWDSHGNASVITVKKKINPAFELTPPKKKKKAPSKKKKKKKKKAPSYFIKLTL